MQPNIIAIMKKSIISLIILFLQFSLAHQTSAQVSQQWVERYNGPGNGIDKAVSVAVDASGNVYVTGQSMGSGTGADYATIKYNPAGVQLWLMRFDGPADSTDVPVGLVIDNSGNVYVTGYSSGGGTGFDFATVKYNTNGVQQWVQRYGTYITDKPVGIGIDQAGNVYIAGNSGSSGSSYVTLKYDPQGVLLWSQNYSPVGDLAGGSYAQSMTVDMSGNVYVTGVSYPGAAGKITTVKYNTNGVPQWAQLYGSQESLTFSITTDISGNVYIEGAYYGLGHTIKYNSFGTVKWDMPGNHNVAAIDNNSNVISAGITFNTVKYDSTGTPQWSVTYPQGGYTNAVNADASGNIYVTGYSGNDYLTVKYSPGGAQQWTESYNGPGNGDDEAVAMALDGQGNVYVTGFSMGAGTDYDFATIKYSQLTGINPISSDIPNSYSLSQNYPNPFNPSTKIKFGVPKSGGVRLVIYDAIGREVATVVNEQLNAGTYEAQWNASNFPSGVYFYKITSGDFSETKKLILIK